jgi:hypothetical protein
MKIGLIPYQYCVVSETENFLDSSQRKFINENIRWHGIGRISNCFYGHLHTHTHTHTNVEWTHSHSLPSQHNISNSPHTTILKTSSLSTKHSFLQKFLYILVNVPSQEYIILFKQPPFRTMRILTCYCSSSVTSSVSAPEARNL